MNNLNQLKSEWKYLGFLNASNFTGTNFNDLPVRYVARPVVVDENNNLLICHSKSLDAHSLPGGGIEENESVDDATKRECLEEIGYNVEILQKIGCIDVCKENSNGFYITTSFCYLVKIFGEQQLPSLQDDEIGLGITTDTYSVERALCVLQEDVDRNGNSHAKRSIIFIEEAKKYFDESGK